LSYSNPRPSGDVPSRAGGDSQGCSVLTAVSTPFRGMVHAKVNAVLLFCFIDKKIFQNVLPICWGERFFADAATNQTARKFGIRTHTNELVA